MNRGSLFASFLKALMDKQREKQLQKAEKIRGEEFCWEKEHKQQLEDALPSIH